MALRLGDIAPNFTAETTEGPIDFHEWIGDSWAVLFSHPKDFTPVCTTELVEFARLAPEFEKRKVQPIGLSVDSIYAHFGWEQNIEKNFGQKVPFPVTRGTRHLGPAFRLRIDKAWLDCTPSATACVCSDDLQHRHPAHSDSEHWSRSNVNFLTNSSCDKAESSDF